jgi:hypothetical protein
MFFLKLTEPRRHRILGSRFLILSKPLFLEYKIEKSTIETSMQNVEYKTENPSLSM